MGFKENRELKKKMLIKKTINEMDKQINKLEQQKQTYIKTGADAKRSGLEAQYNLAVTGLRMTIVQQKRVQQMKLNFEIISQMKDMARMTTEFLAGMSTISKDMLKITKEVNFKKVTENFENAMMGVEVQTEQMESLMDETESSFANNFNKDGDEKREVEALIDNVASGGGNSVEASIDKELEELKKKMSI